MRPSAVSSSGRVPAHAHEEPRADQALEREDLPADGRLRVAEAARGGAERALGRDGAERDQMAQLDAVPVRVDACCLDGVHV